MQVKNQGVQNRVKVGQSESAAPAKTVAKKQLEQPKVQLATPDPNQSVAKGTAQDFVKSATGEKTGKSPLNVRFESQQEMNAKAHRKLDGALKEMHKLERGYVKGFEAEDKADFRTEQAAFQTFMDAQATFAGNLEARGGSLMPLVYASEAKDLVGLRTAVMKDRLESGYTKFSGTSTVTDAPQQVMNAAAWEAFAATDDKLTALTDRIAGKLEGEDLAEFKAANQAFAGYREALATFESNREARGGTLAPLIKAGVAEGMTLQRIEQLKPLLEQLG